MDLYQREKLERGWIQVVSSEQNMKQQATREINFN